MTSRLELVPGLFNALARFYKLVISPVIHTLGVGGCRFQPTCSEYAAIAVHQYGLLKGGWMAFRRLLRCHPGHAGGFDPVPGTWPPPHA